MKKILIIEDDQIVANIYRNKLRVEGFEVEAAFDGETGMELLKAFKPDVLITDLVLPKITGVEFIRNVRADADFSKIPIIVFSNTYLTNMVQEAWKAGATKCLSKASCTPKQVIEAVRGVINGGTAVLPPATSATPARDVSPLKHATQPKVQPATVSAKQSGGTDAEFLDDLRKSFIATLPDTLTSLRTLMKGLTKAENEEARVTQAQELYRRVRTLTGNAGIAGMTHIAQMTDAFEALLKELCEKPANFNPSTMRTVLSAVDFLGWLFDRVNVTDAPSLASSNVLVVDDEILSRRAVTFALDKAKLKSTSVEEPNAAFKMVTETIYDLIILDVDMPGMTGFELCTKIRALPRYKKTPVVFVTSLTDFESRANSTMSGGNDFIGKPFLFVELAVKALIYVLRSRIDAQPNAAPAQPVPAMAGR